MMAQLLFGADICTIQYIDNGQDQTLVECIEILQSSIQHYVLSLCMLTRRYNFSVAIHTKTELSSTMSPANRVKGYLRRL